ncbi:MAG: ATP-grasp domain-containing protein [Jatrophihabitantaceae bacterium]
MTAPMCLIINRFADEYSRYASYLDDSDAQLWLISTKIDGMPGFRRSDFAKVDLVAGLDWATVKQTLDSDPVASAAVRHVVAISEYDLELGAAVREYLGVKGYSAEYIRRFKDKGYSKSLVTGGGVRTPEWMPVQPGMSAHSIDATWSYPVVVKPISGAASSGVRVCADRAELQEKLNGLDPALEWEAERFVPGALYHCDGYAENGVLGYLSTSMYIGSCASFNDGRPLGSVSIQHTPQAQILADGVERSLRALGLENGVFHLEAFIDNGEFVFLEIGHRPGGGEILWVTHRYGGVDLMSVAVRLSCDLPALQGGAPAPPPPAGSFGWVMCSAMGQTGKLVRSVSARGALPPGVTIARAAFPGQVVPDDPEYDFTGVSAHVYADSPAEATAAIERLLDVVVIEYQDSCAGAS